MRPNLKNAYIAGFQTLGHGFVRRSHVSEGSRKARIFCSMRVYRLRDLSGRTTSFKRGNFIFDSFKFVHCNFVWNDAWVMSEKFLICIFQYRTDLNKVSWTCAVTSAIFPLFHWVIFYKSLIILDLRRRSCYTNVWWEPVRHWMTSTMQKRWAEVAITLPLPANLLFLWYDSNLGSC